VGGKSAPTGTPAEAGCTPGVPIELAQWGGLQGWNEEEDPAKTGCGPTRRA